MKLKITFLVCCLLLVGEFTHAQPYNKAIGLRTSGYYGVSYRQFYEGNQAFELILGRYENGLRFTALKEIYKPLGDMTQLYWFYGGGAHIGNSFYYDNNNSRNGFFNLNGGIDGIIGMEYQFKKLPFCVSADWKPSIRLAGYRYSGYDGGAFTLRYYF